MGVKEDDKGPFWANGFSDGLGWGEGKKALGTGVGSPVTPWEC